MSEGKLDDKQVNLLLDVLRVVKRHGTETVAELAQALVDPRFAADLSQVLSSASQAARPATKRPAVKRDGRNRLARYLEDANGMNPTLRAFLERILDDKEAAPSLRDIRSLAQRVGVPMPTSTSRGIAIAQLVEQLLPLPSAELEKIAAELEGMTRRDDRSLDGWNRIIEQNRSAVRSTNPPPVVT